MGYILKFMVYSFRSVVMKTHQVLNLDTFIRTNYYNIRSSNHLVLIVYFKSVLGFPANEP